MQTQAQFKIGDRVKVHAYTDCFGKFHPETEPLIVSAVRLMTPPYGNPAVPPYYRIKADTTGKGYGYHEAAERFFVAVTP
jgi:hypothetical protein